MGVITNDAKINLSQSFVIFGMGKVGIHLAQSAVMVSVCPFVGIDTNNQKLGLSKQFVMIQGFIVKTETDFDEKIKSFSWAIRCGCGFWYHRYYRDYRTDIQFNKCRL